MIRLLLILLLLSSCSPQYHYGKFLKKGGNIECGIDTIQITDTLIQNGDTIITYRDSIIAIGSTKYVTKYETKYIYKTIKEQEKTKRTEAKEETKQIVKVEKIKSECTPKWKIFMLCLGSLLLGYFFRFLVGIFDIPFSYKK